MPDAPDVLTVTPSTLQACDPGSFDEWFDALWACSATVRVYGDTPFLAARIGAPLSDWDNALVATGVNGLPSFTTTNNASLANVSVTGVSGGTTFCGQYIAGTLTVFDASTPDCDTFDNTGSISDLLRHEFAHAVGWIGGSHIGHDGGITGVSDHCALALPSSGGFNTTICHHNIEGVLAAYGLRTLSNTNFWQTPFVWTHNGPTSFSPINLQVTEKDTLVLGAFQKERGGMITGSWHSFSSDTSVATVFGGVITAVDSGTATITIRPNPVSGHFLTSAFGASTRTVQVNVTPQPPAALVVQDIEINTGLPITSAGTYTWTATLGSGDPSGITFRWVFEYSDNSPPDSVFIPARSSGDTVPPWIQPSPYTGAAAGQSRYAHAGDYTIWVKVWPIRDGIAGSPAAREFSVCTGGPALRATPEEGTKEPPPGNDAVGGCPPS